MDNKSQLFQFEEKEDTVRRSFSIVVGGTVETPDDSIEANRFGQWEARTFQNLDREIAWRSALAVHNRSVAEARLADAKRYETQIQALLEKYSSLVPAPEPGKKWRETCGDHSGGRYRNQPDRAPVMELVDKQAATDAGLTRQYIQVKLDTERAREFIKQHPDAELPGVVITVPCPVSFSPMKD